MFIPETTPQLFVVLGSHSQALIHRSQTVIITGCRGVALLLRQPTYISGFKNTNSSYPLLTLTDGQAPDVQRIKEEVYQVSHSTDRERIRTT